MARLRFSQILSILAYSFEVILLFLPEVLTYISRLQTLQRILLVFAMIIVPALPFLFGRAHARIYSFFCKLLKVSADEIRLLSIIWSKPNIDWTKEDICRVTGLDKKKVQNLVRRLKSRGLLANSHVSSKEKGK